MGLAGLLEKTRSLALERWFQAIVETYPDDAAPFLTNGKDPFSNPMGSTFRKAVEAIYDGLAGGVPVSDLSGPIDDIVKLRSIQETGPAKALAFIFDLKGIVRETVGDDADNDALRELDAIVDDLALAAFESYVKSRELISEIRVRETKRAMGKLLERANMAVQLPDLSEADT